MSDFTIIELGSIDSTNNYAMQLIDANKAHHGLTIVADTQTGGKGQRGRIWADIPGESLLMSIILVPRYPISEQFTFNATVAVAIANVLQKLHENWAVHIKWPNDIIINDKKAGGILIENVLRGTQWTYSVVGIGLNIGQRSFNSDLPFATSLKIASGIGFNIKNLREQIIRSILSQTTSLSGSMDAYNTLLYKRGETQIFADKSGQWQATILSVVNDGALRVQHENGMIKSFYHGQLEWIWQ